MKIKKIGLIAVSAVTLLSLTTTSTPILGANPIQEVQASDDSFVSDFRTAQINTINYIRTSNGLPRLEQNSILDNYAQQRAETLAAQGQLDHHKGHDSSQIAPYNGLSGENLAISNDSNDEGATALSNISIIQFWNDKGTPSMGHRKQILDSYTNTVGVGVAKIAGVKYVVVHEYGITKSDFQSLLDKNGYTTYNDNVKEINSNGLGSYSKYIWDRVSGLATTNNSTNQNTPSNTNNPTSPSTNPSSSSVFHRTIGWYGDHTVTITGNSSDIHPLYSKDGKKSNRGLAGNTAWYTDQYLIDQNGRTYYRVSTNEWLPESSTTVFS